MSPLESVDCVFQFFGEGPQFAVVEENTRDICIESSDFYCVPDFSAVKNLIERCVYDVKMSYWEVTRVRRSAHTVSDDASADDQCHMTRDHRHSMSVALWRWSREMIF